jgi:hypothetical protein
LYGKTQAILGSSPATNQAEISIAQDVVLDQIAAIEGDRFKRLTLRRREEFTQRHSKTYILPTAASAPVRASSLEIVAG